jgi:hypothetical protein
LGAEVYWSQTILCLGIGICSVLEKQIGHVHMAFLRCQVQGSEPSLKTKLREQWIGCFSVYRTRFLLPICEARQKGVILWNCKVANRHAIIRCNITSKIAEQNAPHKIRFVAIL